MTTTNKADAGLFGVVFSVFMEYFCIVTHE